MTREQAKKLLPVIQAYAEGAEIEYLRPNGEWATIMGSVGFCEPPELYRIKPQPKMVPLGPEDVPPGSVLRFLSLSPKTWVAVQAVGERQVDTREVVWQFDELQRNGAEISRDGGKTWHKCEKEEQ